MVFFGTFIVVWFKVWGRNQSFLFNMVSNINIYSFTTISFDYSLIRFNLSISCYGCMFFNSNVKVSNILPLRFGLKPLYSCLKSQM